jgi:large subunit ribosomal protein L37Ae
MGRTKKMGLARGLGPRYGSTVRKRYIKVMTEMRKPHRCPSCGLPRVKRESVGVWVCRKCGFKYTGGAYTPVTKLGAVAKRSAKGVPAEEAEKEETPAAPAEEEETA